MNLVISIVVIAILIFAYFKLIKKADVPTQTKPIDDGIPKPPPDPADGGGGNGGNKPPQL